MSFEEPTQRLTVPPGQSAPAQTTAAQTTAALPRPLDLAGPTPPSSPDPADKTDELSLDEIFAAPAEAQTPEPLATEEAPTWTAMPVIPVRSEPTPAPAGASSEAETAETAQTHPKRTGPSTSERLRTDAAAALNGTLRRSRAWLTHNDNGLMLMTAIVAIVLILAVAALGS